jgi:quinol monooxygenase YgiN
VTRNEPDALNYEWFLNEDESVGTVIEVYKDVPAVNTHTRQMSVHPAASIMRK